ncbi:hypothetical protein Bhyg_04131 [Pseudolycoriella hygida]|uniref:Uncharacterized protein n=1 Tax=Pseudolycoriella hygida TaxID=35572 RepID=A0A9Q0NEM6_9DIPT|nr:hypothetical protein Bhyg_04131 [Pseudolycoriella hygida]
MFVANVPVRSMRDCMIVNAATVDPGVEAQWQDALTSITTTMFDEREATDNLPNIDDGIPYQIQFGA